MIKKLLYIFLLILTFNSGATGTQDITSQNQEPGEEFAVFEKKEANSKIATLGGGCFWCTEAVFEGQTGIIQVVSGYAGGHVKNPTYEQVSAKKTGHAEVVNIEYNPSEISYREILELFFRAHDPTTPNQQGADVGPQYRSIILYHDQEQQNTAKQIIEELAPEFGVPIVTEIKKYTEFYPAEIYHQDFYANNPNYGYCQVVIRPKLQKLGLE